MVASILAEPGFKIESNGDVDPSADSKEMEKLRITPARSDSDAA